MQLNNIRQWLWNGRRDFTTSNQPVLYIEGNTKNWTWTFAFETECRVSQRHICSLFRAEYWDGIKGNFPNVKFRSATFGRYLGHLFLTMLSNKNIHMVYRHKTDNGECKFDSKEIRNMLGDIPLQQKEIKEAIITLIKNNLKEIEAIK